MSTLGIYPEELVQEIFIFGGLAELKCNAFMRGFLNNLMVITST